MRSTAVDGYIASHPEPVRKRLCEMREIIRAAAPDAEERMAYGIPTLYLNGNLVHFAGYAGHIGFYPAPSGIAAFKAELKKYTHSKGAVQFPLDKPLPTALIKKIVRFRVEENTKK